MAVTQESGTHTHAADLTEQDVLEIDPGGVATIYHNVEIDCSNLTRTTLFRFYREIGGSYQLRDGVGTDGGQQTYTPGVSGPLVFFWHDSVSYNDKTKVTAETQAVAEGAARSIPWQYGLEN